MGHHRFATPDLGRIFRGETVVGFSEWQLLERYLQSCDQVAFEALVARHGPMVLGVCRRMLTNQADVEDAFQATFLVLVRRAPSLGPRDAIGPWLYGVATRVALRSRSESARRHRLRPIVADVATTRDDLAAENRETGEALDQELSRLPSKYRHPIVLCYLEGQTHEEAARQLKWPIGTVKGRLARARELLQSRLARRGAAPAVGALALNLSLCDESWASVHRALLDRTVRLAFQSAVRQASNQIVPASITSLVEGVLTSMLLNSLKLTGVGILAGGLALSGIAVMARQDSKPTPAEPENTPVSAKAGAPAASVNINTVTSEKPLAAKPAPESAPASIEDTRRDLARAASREWDEMRNLFIRISMGPDQAYAASKRLMEAEKLLSDGPANRGKPENGHLQRIRELSRIYHDQHYARPEIDARLRAYAAEATFWLTEANSAKAGNRREAGSAAGVSTGRGNDAKSQAILAKLEEPIAMSFSAETPLEDLLKYIKQATTTQTYAGIPIYVDPLGLQEAEKSMTSTVRNMDLEGVPLKRTLQLMLKQLDLVYFVEDGMLYITSSEPEGPHGHLEPAIAEPSPILLKVAEAERGELSLAEMKELLEVLKTREQIMKLSDGAHAEQKQESKEAEDEKRNHEQMDLLLKEIRGLVGELKAERQKTKADEKK